MNKSELIDAVTAKSGLAKADVNKALDTFVEVITRTLKKNDKVALMGFGTFMTRSRSARTGRNPKTGAPLKIKASKNPTFKAGKALKDAIK